MSEQIDIQPEQVKRKLDAGEQVLLIDCREAEELAAASIEGATHIPMGDVPARLQELDPEVPVIVFCHHGIRSQSVAHFLREQDFDEVLSMAGGIDAWSLRIDPAVPRYE